MIWLDTRVKRKKAAQIRRIGGFLIRGGEAGTEFPRHDEGKAL